MPSRRFAGPAIGSLLTAVDGNVPRSIRFRITALATILSAVLLGIVSVLMVMVLRTQLTENVDESLGQRADTIEALIGDSMPDMMRGDEDLIVQVIGPDGAILTESPNLSGVGPITSEPGFRTLRDIPGHDEGFRTLARRLQLNVGPSLLVVGVMIDDITEPVSILTRLLTAAVPAVVSVLLVLTWWLTGRTLRPVEKLRSEMAEITGANLGRRVVEPGTGDEIDRLARTMNLTLDRLEDAVRRQRRFVADASHELRGPLTRIRGELELDLARPELAVPGATERTILEDTISLQHLVEDLLQLARRDSDVPVAMTSEPVDLDDIVLREARRLSDRGRAQIDTRGVSAAQVMGDADQLGRAVKNLLDNAERHAASTVAITLAETDGIARLTVSDDGEGIPVEDREVIFERFTRLDEARTRDAGGSGLGLAITRDIVERHDGTIHLQDTLPTRFVVELPVRP